MRSSMVVKDVICASERLRHIGLSSLSLSSLRVVVREAHTESTTPAVAAAISSASSSSTSEPSTSVGANGEEVFKKQTALWRLVKASLLLSSTAAIGTAAYVTYALDVKQVESKVLKLKASANVNASEDGGLLDNIQKVVYTTAIDGVVKVAEVYLEIRKSLEDQVRGFAAPSSDKLLPDLRPHEAGIFTLVLDLNETLVHSDWKRDRGWRTFKRPGVEAFLEQLAQYYELVVYSDQLSFYVDPVLERLDQKGCIRARLSRDATQYVHGKHFRDLTKLNRDLSHVIYLSGHAVESCLQPENALPVKAWKLENDDTALLDLLPFLEFVARQRPADIRPVLASFQGLDIATEFRERTKEYQRRMQERKQQSRLPWRAPTISRPSS
ncbi:unnamed protein product [Sphagnum tenellum]